MGQPGDDLAHPGTPEEPEIQVQEVIVDLPPEIPGDRLIDAGHEVGSDEPEEVLEEEHHEDEDDDPLDRCLGIAAQVDEASQQPRHHFVHPAVPGLGHRGGIEQSADELAVLKGRILAIGDLMGLLQQDPDTWFQQAGEGAISASEIEALIAERQQAKLDKNYARADEIRASLAVQGVVLEDSREGTSWRRE